MNGELIIEALALQVFLDVTSMIDYNSELLNQNDLSNSFFQLSKTDLMLGFAFDASRVCGQTYPVVSTNDQSTTQGELASIYPSYPELDYLALRLILGSHLAYHMRKELEECKGYTAAVGISTSKLLSKLVGSVHKPHNQTTLLPPYENHNGQDCNVTRFLDPFEIQKVPGIGSRIAQRIRTRIQDREQAIVEIPEKQAANDSDALSVGDVRLFPGMCPAFLQEVFYGGGWPKDIGIKIWGLLNGIDNTPVSEGKSFPTQISIEDSYSQLDNIWGVKKELLRLANSLLRRMHIDLTEHIDDDDDDDDDQPESLDIERKILASSNRKWLAHPRTLRLSTRPRLPSNQDGSRNHYSSRASRSCPLPNFIFSFNENIGVLAERLVQETIVPLFHKLHPGTSGWKLSLINIAVTNMIESAGSEKSSAGRDIGKMFRSQERVLRDWKLEKDGNGSSDIVTVDTMPSRIDRIEHEVTVTGENHESDGSDGSDGNATWDSDEEMPTPSQECPICGVLMPYFAIRAHETYHSVPD